MAHSTSYPLPKFGIPWIRKEPSIPSSLHLALLLRISSRRLPLLSRWAASHTFSSLPLLPLLPVIHQKGQGSCQTYNYQTLQDSIVNIVVVIVATRHGVLSSTDVEVHVLVLGVEAIWVDLFIILEEVGDPFAERAEFFGLCKLSARFNTKVILSKSPYEGCLMAS